MRLKNTNEIFADDLRDPTYAAGYLNISLEDDGVEGFLYALQKVARAHGVSKVAESSDMPRELLYRALSDKGNPGVRPLARVLDALGLRLTVMPAEVALEKAVPQEAATADTPATAQDSRAVPANLFAEEVSELRHMMAHEFAAMREETAARQEAMRREAEMLRSVVRRMTALAEQVVDSVAGQAIDRGQRTYRNPNLSTPYSFPLGRSRKQQVNAEAYQPHTLRFGRTGS